MTGFLRLTHLLGLVLFLGSILTFAVASGVPAAGDLAALAVARRLISAGTDALTLPGLSLLCGSGVALAWRRTRPFQCRSFGVMLLAAGGTVANALFVVLPAVRSATALALTGAASGQLPPSYSRAYALESGAGGVNVLLAILAMAAGIRLSRATTAERSIARSPSEP